MQKYSTRWFQAQGWDFRDRGWAFDKRGGTGIGGAWLNGRGIVGQGQGGGVGAHEGGTEKSGVALNPRGTTKSTRWGSLGAEVNWMGEAMSDLSELP